MAAMDSHKQDTIDGLGKGSRVWFRKQQTWHSATLQSQGRKCVVREDTQLGEGTGEPIEIPQEHVVPANPSLLDGVADLTALSFLNEPSITHALKQRYGSDTIYTHAGPVLVAVNPFKTVPLYSKEHVKHYMARPTHTAAPGASGEEYEPHVYLTADAAYKQMVGTGKSQSILITGESGAGKTETTKIAMKYLAGLAGGTGMEDRVLETNPILEAFGNAKTIHNNNSSRFGKLIEIYFNNRRAICGAHIQTYLLEKSRVVHQLPNERSYHVFYQLCRGATDEEREECILPKDNATDQFAYLANSGCDEIAGVNDAADFAEVKQAMNAVGISSEQQNGIWKILSAVLWLGNIHFTRQGDDAVCVQGDGARTALGAAAYLLGCSEATLEAALTTRKMVVGAENITKHLNMDAAVENRDALAKAVYEALFRWLVNRINEALSTGAQGRVTGLCILDIYGFECFKENSFEQLCINYANERLQQQFAAHMLKLEQEVYEKEGVKWARVEFEDNQECVDLIESRPPNGLGLLSLLDEECMFPKGTDSSFSQKLRRQHAAHPRFSYNPKIPGDDFTLHHYAGAVNYSANKFLDKNKDALSPDLVELLKASSCKLTTALAAELVKGQERRGSQTVGARFRDQLRDLMTRLDETSLHFIRCIKPNSKQEPSHFDQALILHQLRCCGVLEVARIARAGYPTRYPHVEFAERYRMLLPGLSTGPLPAGMTPLDVGVQVLEHFRVDPASYQVGKTKLFFRAGVLGQLEDKKERLLRAVVTVQSGWRMVTCQRAFLRARWAAITVQAHRRGMVGRQYAKERRQQRDAAIVIQSVYRQHKARQQYAKSIAAVVAIQMAWRRYQVAGRVNKRLQERLLVEAALKEEQDRIAAEQAVIEAARQAEQESYNAIKEEFKMDGAGIREILALYTAGELIHSSEVEAARESLKQEHSNNAVAAEAALAATATAAAAAAAATIAGLEADLAESRAYAQSLETELNDLRAQNDELLKEQFNNQKSLITPTSLHVKTYVPGEASIQEEGTERYSHSDDSISIMSYSDGNQSPGPGSGGATSSVTPKMVIGRAGVPGAVAALSYEFDKKSELFTDDSSFIKEVVDGVSSAPGMDLDFEMHRLLQRYKAWKNDFKARIRATQHAVRKLNKGGSLAGTPRASDSQEGGQQQQKPAQVHHSIKDRLKSFAHLKKDKTAVSAR